LLGWSTYFGYGTRLPAYRAIDNHVYDRVRRFLVRRHKVPSHGTNRFPREAVFGALGCFTYGVSTWDPRRVPCDEARRKAGCGKSARPV
jgi:RNA-directed DNA polymerase